MGSWEKNLFHSVLLKGAHCVGPLETLKRFFRKVFFMAGLQGGWVSSGGSGKREIK